MKTAALRKACDNLTTVIIAFNNFDHLLQNYKSKSNKDLLKEEDIEEIILEPIPEDQDDTI